jgi:mono/diheme cytochrome c family protein
MMRPIGTPRGSVPVGASSGLVRAEEPVLRLLSAFILAIAWFAVPARANDDAIGKQLFTKGATPPCAICHTMKDAGATGEVGPSLDELKPDAERVAKAVRNGIGQMPAFTTLTEQQVQAIAQYVARATGGAK